MKALLRVPVIAAGIASLLPVSALAQSAAVVGSGNETPPSPGDDKVDALIQLLVSEGIISPDKALALGARAKSNPGAPAPSPRSTATADARRAAPKGPTMAQIENQGAVRQPEATRAPEAAPSSRGYAFPANRDPSVDPSAPIMRNAALAAQDQAWTDRIRLDGDIRIRWQSEYLDGDTSSTIPNWAALSTGGSAVPVSNFLSDADRARLRFRARLGFTARVDDHFTAVIRLAAGNLTEPTSTDPTFGDFFNRDGVGIDRAYLQWKPSRDITVTAGRMPNPLYTTNLMWDGDVNPEGISVTYRRKLGSGYVFATGSAFYLEENGDETPDRYLYAAQFGVAGLAIGPNTNLRLAASYYDWSHYRGKVGDSGTTTPVLGVGNTLIDLDTSANRVLPGVASPFRLLELLGSVSQRIGSRYALTGAFDVVWNTAYDEDELRKLPLLTEPTGNFAWMAAATFGDPNVSEWGRWQLTASYRRLQTDALVAGYTEGDYNPGGTNREAIALDGLVGLDHNAWLQLSWLRNRFLAGPPYAYHGFRVQLNSRF